MSSLPTVVTILYPATKNFNLDYYLENHMPLAQKTWGPYGLQSYTVSRVVAGDQYSIECFLFFKSKESQATALGEHAAEVMADVVNFSDVQPTFISAEIVKST